MCMFSTYNLHDIYHRVIAVNGYCEKNWVATPGSGKPKLRIYEFIFFSPRVFAQSVLQIMATLPAVD